MIVASIASLSSRIGLLEQTVASLTPQVDALCVYLNGHDNIPSFLRHPKVVHAILSKEAGWRGAEAKFWPFDRKTFKAVPQWSDDDIAFTCDDDIIYPSDYVERMVDLLARHPGSVACVHGSILMQPFTSYATDRRVAPARGPLLRDSQVHIPGTGTVAFKLNDVEIDLGADFRWSHAVDPQLATMLNQRGIEVWSIARDAGWLKPMQIPSNVTSIYRQRVGCGNDDKETSMLQGIEWPELSHDVEGFATRSSMVTKKNKSFSHVQPRSLVSTLISPGSMLPDDVFRWLQPRLWALSPGIVVELGSGHGTQKLVSMLPADVSLCSVEHAAAFVGLVQGTRYIHAPLIQQWYSHDVLRSELPARNEIQALIIDGPPKRGRSLIIDHLELFPETVPILMDDVHRDEEMSVVKELAARRRQSYSIHHCADGRCFATMGWGIP